MMMLPCTGGERNSVMCLAVLTRYTSVADRWANSTDIRVYRALRSFAKAILIY